MKIILATKNQGKLKEFQQLSKGMGFEFIAIPEELEEMPDETGKTFKENALIKAAMFPNISKCLLLQMIQA